jgi:hypothetical protein
MSKAQWIKENLRAAEEYGGIVLGKNGAPDEHVILLPGEKIDINWKDAQAWAKSIGGALPTRREQALLFANLKEHFQSRYYWSGEQHAGISSGAWSQGFGHGIQLSWAKGVRFCARAVRKLAIL